MTTDTDEREATMAEAIEDGAACPRCGAAAGEPCRSPGGRERPGNPHQERRGEAAGGGAGPEALVPARVTRDLRIPLVRTDQRARRFFEVKLTPVQARGLRALTDGLIGAGHLTSGRVVRKPQTALRWLFERLGEAVDALGEGEATEVPARVEVTDGG